MPKRTTNFQDLIELLERQLAPAGAKVFASKLLKDSRSGEEREVDIVIEVKSGIHPVAIGIEVIEQKRPASSTWIEGIAKKHEDLAIDKTIAVSRSGFYEPAIKKANAYKIDTLTLKEASELDWKAKIDHMPSVKIVSLLLPYLTNVTVLFTSENSLSQFNDVNLETVNLETLELFMPSGKSRGTLRAVLERIITDNNFVRQVEEMAFTDSGTTIEGELRLEKGSFVKGINDEKHEIHSIKFTTKCRKEEMDAELIKGRYRDTAVVMASGASFGRATNIVFSENNDGENPIVSLRIKMKTKRK